MLKRLIGIFIAYVVDRDKRLVRRNIANYDIYMIEIQILFRLFFIIWIKQIMEHTHIDNVGIELCKLNLSDIPLA